MEEREVGDLRGFNNVYFQESRSAGSLLYTGNSLIPEAYTKDGYKGKSSSSYEYITYNEAFSARVIVFKVPMSYLRKE